MCDAHTAVSIQSIDTKIKDKELKYVMDKFLIFEYEWIKVYPKDNINYDAPTTEKKKDRYSFTFNKKKVLDEKTIVSDQEVFIVESSHKIDIDVKQNYNGHLIIPDIGDNGYWLDFENDEATKYSIKRISDYKVEVTVYGLKSKRLNLTLLVS